LEICFIQIGSDPALLWLWCRLTATALIRPLAWEPPYAVGAALEKAKRQKKKKRKEKKGRGLETVFGNKIPFLSSKALILRIHPTRSCFTLSDSS